MQPDRGMRWLGAGAILLAFATAWPGSARAAPIRQMERLDRGVVAAPAQGGGWLISWRLLDAASHFPHPFRAPLKGVDQ